MFITIGECTTLWGRVLARVREGVAVTALVSMKLNSELPGLVAVCAANWNVYRNGRVLVSL